MRWANNRHPLAAGPIAAPPPSVLAQRLSRWLCGRAGGPRLRATRCLLAIAFWWTACSALAAEPRDPFMFGPGDGEALGGRGQLTGILWDATTPLAVIDGEPLGVGSVVAGWTVTAIAPDHVAIERDHRRETVVLGASFPSG